MREFKSGAIRSNSNGKIDWHGVYHPLVELSYGKYMKKHTMTEDGTIREFDNWHGGWDKKISLQSLVRHVKDLDALYSGYRVYKYKHIINKKVIEEETFYLQQNEVVKSAWPPEETKIEIVTEEECSNAIRFNCGAYLLNLLTIK